ncbi:hypothetical protein [Streptomyces sp. NPDC087300]|uniref:hypothetical protein n=1 Tax=Streptomyces sp. NPDC087300 TaxID=3365780 RepID=UPI0038132F03
MARLTWGTKAGRLALSSCAALVAVALLAGGYYWWGGPHERRVARQVLDEACGGVLPAADLRAVLGDGPFRSGPGRLNTGDAEGDTGDAEADADDRRQVTCSVSRATEHGTGRATHDASVEVSVRRVPERKGDDTGTGRATGHTRGIGALYPTVSDELPPAALGHGWQGLFVTGEGLSQPAVGNAATTTVLLDCARGRGGLLVTVGVEEDDVTLDDPRLRTAYARIATGTAAEASERWGCDARLGAPLKTVALPVDVDEDVPLADADGTCRGLPGRGSRISRAWEAARSGGPVEVCLLGGGSTGVPAEHSPDEQRRYRLVAEYGPYAESRRLDYQEHFGGSDDRPAPGAAPAGRIPGGGHWASAACRDGRGPALFTVRPGDATDRPEYNKDGTVRAPKASAADLAYERAALTEFARRSAKEHGCAAPKLP